jgi:acetyl esterase
MLLHPQAQALLRLLEEKGVPPTHTLSPGQARRMYLERRGFSQPEPPAVAETRELSIPGPAGTIAARLFRPLGSAPGDRLPALVFFHGGGWVIGDLDTHDTLCRELANGAGCAVVSVDYRLAPEHRFPAAVDDAFAALRWVHRQAASLDIDASRLAVGGDSAGGNLAAVAALEARDAGNLPLSFQLLIYPVTDLRRGTDSYRTHGSGYSLGSDAMRYFCNHYLGGAPDETHWRASPLLHADLGGLPPALVITAGFDPLRDEGLQYAQKLTQAGNTATHICFERQMHGFILMGKLIDEANTAVRLCASELRQALS